MASVFPFDNSCKMLQAGVALLGEAEQPPPGFWSWGALCLNKQLSCPPHQLWVPQPNPCMLLSHSSGSLIPESSCHTAPKLKEMPAVCHGEPLLSLPLSYSGITEHLGRISFLRALPFPVNHCLTFLLAKQSEKCSWSR